MSKGNKEVKKPKKPPVVEKIAAPTELARGIPKPKSTAQVKK